jgi:hypothetical protein
VNGAHRRLHGADDAKISTFAALRLGFNLGHGNLSGRRRAPLTIAQ